MTHTIGVFALGLVTLALSAYVLPEDLYPWLNLASGLLVVGVGAGVAAHARRAGAARARARTTTTITAPHDHGTHHHAPPADITPRGLLAMGASAGLIPCPSALVVLLGAIAQHQVALGLVLIVAFSLGLAATLTALGLAVVTASGGSPGASAPRRKAPRDDRRRGVGGRDRRGRRRAHRAGRADLVGPLARRLHACGPPLLDAAESATRRAPRPGHDEQADDRVADLAEVDAADPVPRAAAAMPSFSPRTDAARSCR